MVELQKARKCDKDGQVLNQSDIKLWCSIILWTHCAPWSKVLIFGQNDLRDGGHGSKENKLQSKELTLQKNCICQIVVVFVSVALAAKEEPEWWR
jgi:hypothetical protein